MVSLVLKKTRLIYGCSAAHYRRRIDVKCWDAINRGISLASKALYIDPCLPGFKISPCLSKQRSHCSMKFHSRWNYILLVFNLSLDSERFNNIYFVQWLICNISVLTAFHLKRRKENFPEKMNNTNSSFILSICLWLPEFPEKGFSTLHYQPRRVRLSSVNSVHLAVSQWSLIATSSKIVPSNCLTTVDIPANCPSISVYNVQFTLTRNNWSL